MPSRSILAKAGSDLAPASRAVVDVAQHGVRIEHARHGEQPGGGLLVNGLCGERPRRPRIDGDEGAHQRGGGSDRKAAAQQLPARQIYAHHGLTSQLFFSTGLKPAVASMLWRTIVTSSRPGCLSIPRECRERTQQSNPNLSPRVLHPGLVLPPFDRTPGYVA